MEPNGTNTPTQNQPWHGVKLSKAEKDLYGDMAALVRRVGDAAQAIEDAYVIASKISDESARADEYTGGERVDLYPDSPDCSHMVSPHTHKWIKRHEHLRTHLNALRNTHRNFAHQGIQDETDNQKTYSQALPGTA